MGRNAPHDDDDDDWSPLALSYNRIMGIVLKTVPLSRLLNDIRNISQERKSRSVETQQEENGNVDRCTEG